MSYTSLLIDTCDIETITRTADGGGGFTESWAVYANNAVCRRFQYSAKEQAIYGREGVMLTDKFYILPDATVNEQDYRVVHSTGTFHVRGVRYLAGTTDYMVLDCERVKA